MVVFLILVLLFIVFIFFSAFDTKDKRSFLNGIGLDLSPEQIEKNEEKDLNKKANSLIGYVEIEIEKYGSYKNPKEKLQQIYDKISNDFQYRDSPIADRALEILQNKLYQL